MLEKKPHQGGRKANKKVYYKRGFCSRKRMTVHKKMLTICPVNEVGAKYTKSRFPPPVNLKGLKSRHCLCLLAYYE